MKPQLTLILMITSFLCAAQDENRNIFSLSDLKEFTSKPYEFERQIEESSNWKINEQVENDSMIIQRYESQDGNMLLRSIIWKENGKKFLVSVVQFVFIEQIELTKRRELIEQNGWKQFKKVTGTGGGILSYAYSKDADILLTAEYTDYYTEAICQRKYLNRIYKFMR